MKLNILKSGALRDCTSCQMCAAVCPTSAIDIRLNEDGFYRPYVDEVKCIDCGVCVRSCYKYDNNIRQTKDIQNKKIYAAWAKDSQIVKKTTSGGIADVLAKSLIDKGYKCIGVIYDTSADCAIGKVASTQNDIISFRGSKYIQSLSFNAFKTLVKECKNDKFAVFGLPCQIYAIDRFLRNRHIRESHILIDLFCHGCPSLNIWTKYIQDIKTKYNAKSIISTDFRSKIRGWGAFYVVVVVVVVEGVSHPITIKSPRIGDKFYELFFSDQVLNDSCPSCACRSTLEYTDLRLGDFWGNQYLTNHKGVSAVCIGSSRGQDIINDIAPNLNMESQSMANFLPYQSYGRTYPVNSSLRQRMLSVLNSPNGSLEEAIQLYHSSWSFKQRILRQLKNFVKLTPPSVISGVKAIIYKLRK